MNEEFFRTLVQNVNFEQVILPDTKQDKRDYKIKNILSCPAGKGLDVFDLRRLKRHFLLKNLIDNAELSPYYDILECIIDATRQCSSIKDFSETEAWMEAIQIAFWLNHLNGNYFSDPDRLGSIYQREYELAKSAKKIRSQGFDFCIEDGELKIDHAELRRYVEEIEKDVRLCGAVNVLQFMFDFLSKEYNAAQERYSVRRCTASAGRGQQQIPWGFLYQISCKHLNAVTFNPSAFVQSKFKSLVEKVIDLGAIFDVQPYSQFDGMFWRAKGLSKYLYELAVYDTLFTFSQLKPNYVVMLISNLFNWVDDNESLQRIGFSPKNAAEFTQRILGLAKQNPHEPMKFSRKHLDYLLPTTNSIIVDELLKNFTHLPPDPNKDYLIPSEHQTIDSWLKPLIKCKDGDYILTNHSAVAVAFYESTASIIRNSFKTAETKIGTEFEKLFREKLKLSGIKYSYGTYRVRELEGDCDVVIETSNRILLFELKKKPLTRKSRSGQDIDIIINLTSSLVEAQKQLGQQELLLRKNGCLTLKSDQGEYTISLNNRSIERIAVTMLDYGSFHDRLFLKEIMKIFIFNRIEASSEEHEKSFNNLTESCKKISDQFREIQQLLPDSDNDLHDLLMSCWFLSFPQILTVLEEVSSNEDFSKSLLSTRHMITGSRDFYFDHAYMKNLKPA